MKKLIVLFLALALSVCLMVPAALASESRGSMHWISVADSKDVTVGDTMTYEEMIAYFAKASGISYQTAQERFPASKAASSSYRALSVTLDVADNYKPRLEFLCEVSASGNYWGILSIYSVQLIQGSLRFVGDVEVFLRSAYQIEYVINGTFYGNGTSNSNRTEALNLKVGDGTIIKYSGINCNEVIYPFYDHKLVAFQG